MSFVTFVVNEIADYLVPIMKPAPFNLFRPKSVDEALTLLQSHGDEAKVLAGGQSLVPLMNFRLAQPHNLIDLTES